MAAMVDTSLENRLSAVLRRNPHFAGRQLEFEAQEGRVTLKGVVRSYYQKQMAQELVRAIEGVKQIENQLQVQEPLGFLRSRA
jgi:osmotically-inducible protein OsmY